MVVRWVFLMCGALLFSVVGLGCNSTPPFFPPPSLPDLGGYDLFTKGPIEVSPEHEEYVEVVEHVNDDGETTGYTVRVRDALSHFEAQDNPASCTAAAVNIVRSIRGQATEPQAVLTEKHQRGLSQLAPGGRADAEAIQTAIETLQFDDRPVLRVDDALMGWEIQDALVPGHLDEMRERGFLILGPHSMGLPFPSEKARSAFGLPSNHYLGVSIAQREPVLVTMLTGEKLELNRHAFVVVGVRCSEDWEAEEVLVLDPADDPDRPNVWPYLVEEFNWRVRTFASVPLVEREQEFEREWVREAGLRQGFHVRRLDDRSWWQKVRALFRPERKLQPAKSVLSEEVLGDEDGNSWPF